MQLINAYAVGLAAPESRAERRVNWW